MVTARCVCPLALDALTAALQTWMVAQPVIAICENGGAPFSEAALTPCDVTARDAYQPIACPNRNPGAYLNQEVVMLKELNGNTRRVVNGAVGSAAGGSAGAAIGGSVVAGVCAVGGSLFGPVGTFFGLAVGSATGAAVGGAIGSVSGFLVGASSEG